MPLKVREIIKMVESGGWSLARTRGSHRSTFTQRSAAS
jgi:predicted RNA binding protein YcfA (HicA-like mRNA interferase family)